jgi:hypothetical protein
MVRPSTTPTALKKGSQEETMVDNPSQENLEKEGDSGGCVYFS